MTLYDYIASNNPYEANDLLRGYGFEDSDSISTISSRLKLVVREHKTDGLREISKIHPDKDLMSSFISIPESEEKFLNATGRTPEFADPKGFEESIVEPATNFAKEGFDDLKNIQVKALSELNRIKRQINKQKQRRHSNQNGNSMELSTNTMLMLGIAFAIGYLIGKK